MKLLPLTEQVLQQLADSGFTHLVFRKSHQQLVENALEDVITMQAVSADEAPEDSIEVLSADSKQLLANPATLYYILVERQQLA